MRKFLIVIVGIGALASILLCGSYGYDQAVETKDRWTQAFVYGFVSGATLALHVLALRVWVSGWRKTGSFIGVIAMLAFVMTAFTSLGGLASRSDKVIAERQTELDTKADVKAQIDKLVAENAALKFTRTTQAGIDAAQRAVEAAKLAKDRECGDGSPRQRGTFCRQKEDAEAVALAALGRAQDNKATTDRVIEIDAELKRLRSLKADGTVGAADPLKALLGKIMGTYADLLTAWQKAVFAVIYDLCLVALMIGIEVLGHMSVKPTRSDNMSAKPANDATTEVVHPVANPARVPDRPRPKLATSTRQPVGALLDFLHDGVDIIDRERTEMSDGYLGYSSWCQAQGLRPLSVETFATDLLKLCGRFGIPVLEEAGSHFLINVRLKRAS